MKIKEVQTNVYECTNCQKQYKLMKSCEEHEINCIGLDRIFEHDAKFTYPTYLPDSISFYRYGKVNWSRSSYPVSLAFDRQSSINDKVDQIRYSYPFIREDKPNDTEIAYKNIQVNMFNWIACEENKNRVYIKNNKSLLGTVSIEFVFENGENILINNESKINFDLDSNGDIFIDLQKHNRIVKVRIIDNPVEIFESITEYVVPSKLSDDQVFYPKLKQLLNLVDGNYSVDEDIAKYFIKNTKLSPDNLPDYIRLDSRRVRHNTDDWLHVSSNSIHHFQGSSNSYGKKRGGINRYGGKTELEGLLTKFLFDEKFIVRDFYVNDRKIQFNECSWYCNPGAYKYYEDGVEIDSNIVTDLIASNDFKITVKYYYTK